MTQYLGYMIGNLLTKLFNAFKNTVSNHKKKLIALAILFLGYKIIRRKIKTQSIISIAMFFVKFWAKVTDYLPIPTQAAYRLIQPFQFIQTQQISQLSTLIDIKEHLLKIKKKQLGSLNQLKSSVISAVMLNIVLYKVPTIYDVISRKYKHDFMELGAASQFQQSITLLKNDFLSNLNNFRLFISNQISHQLEDLNLVDVVNVSQVEKMFKGFFNHIYKDTVDISSKVLSRKTHYQKTKQFKVAQNYFKTTNKYIEQKKPSKFASVIKVLSSPLRLAYKSLNFILREPISELTTQRFSLNEFLYILPLKRLEIRTKWPNLQSQHLFNLIIQELITFFYSVNFNVVSHRYATHQLAIFSNRLNIYFEKRVAGGKKEKKILDLLPVFYKIVQEQMIFGKSKAQFYERQLLAAFRDTRYRLNHDTTPIKEYRFRNKILQQIYYKNELQHLEKDMQAKLYNERDGLTIEAMGKVSRIYEQKDEIQQLMQIYNRADQQNPTTRQQLQMMRQITES